VNGRAVCRGARTEELAVRGATLRLTWAREDHTAPPILALDGECDLETVPEIDRFLRRRLGPLYRHDDLVIDLGGTTFADSSFIGFLVRLVADQRTKRKELVLARPRGQVRRLLALVGLPNLVPVFETLDEAVVALVHGGTPLIPPAFSAISA
jgi:anti-sigma B factor antagonist